MLQWTGAALLVLILAGGAFVAGRLSAGDNLFLSSRRIDELSAQVDRLKADNGRLSEAYNSTATQLEIERGASKTLESQVARLEDERDRLNRDLALFDNLFPAHEQTGIPSIRSFRVEPVIASGNPSTWRYRALVMRGGKADGNFRGQFRLQVRYRLDGQEIQATTRDSGNFTDDIELQRYRRIEGHFQSPPGATLLGATAQVMQNGKPVSESRFRP